MATKKERTFQYLRNAHTFDLWLRRRDAACSGVKKVTTAKSSRGLSRCNSHHQPSHATVWSGWKLLTVTLVTGVGDWHQGRGAGGSRALPSTSL